MLFEQQYYYVRSDRTYDVAPDGRFLMVKEGATTDDASAPTAQIILVEKLVRGTQAPRACRTLSTARVPVAVWGAHTSS